MARLIALPAPLTNVSSSTITSRRVTLPVFLTVKEYSTVSPTTNPVPFVGALLTCFTRLIAAAGPVTGAEAALSSVTFGPVGGVPVAVAVLVSAPPASTSAWVRTYVPVKTVWPFGASVPVKPGALVGPVVNVIVALATQDVSRRGDDAYYQVVSGASNPLPFHKMYEYVREYFLEHPVEGPDGKPVVVPEWKFPANNGVESSLAVRERLVDLGFVGEPARINTELLEAIEPREESLVQAFAC